MKSRFTSLVILKNSTMQQAEQALQQANSNLNKAKESFENSLKLLHTIESPSAGSIAQLLSARSLFASQREIIATNQEWVIFAQEQVELAKNRLKKDTIEYEKFKYLDNEEIKKMQLIIAKKNAKDLDEIALITHTRNNKKGN